MKKRLLILGASGSIGTQTIDVVRKYGDLFEITGLSIYNNIEFLKNILLEFKTIKHAYLKERDIELEEKFPHVRFYYGEKMLVDICDNQDYDLMVNALVGNTGMLPTIATIKNNKDVALANKETLVIAGEIITDLAKKHNVKIYPVDSEHSAIYQAMINKDFSQVKRLILTASGGSFRDKSKVELMNVRLEDALKHPTWSMGKKVTIDSSTLINKVYEIIEAHYLFNIAYEKIDAIIQKESIIHSMVELNDGSVLAQMSVPDMHLPIQFALTAGKHLELGTYQKLDFEKLSSLNFMKIDKERYSLFDFALSKVILKGNNAAILNGANDKAVELFIEGKINYLDIEKAIVETFKNIEYIKNPSFEQLVTSQKQAQDFVVAMFEKNHQ